MSTKTLSGTSKRTLPSNHYSIQPLKSPQTSLELTFRFVESGTADSDCSALVTGQRMTISKTVEAGSPARCGSPTKKHSLASKQRRPRGSSAHERKLQILQYHLELRDLTVCQPSQVTVQCDDGSERVVMLTSVAARQKRSKAFRGGRSLHAREFTPQDFSVSGRYRCMADPQGQVQGGVGFIYKGIDVATGAEVAVKFFHKSRDPAALSRYNAELVSGLNLHRHLHERSHGDDVDLDHVVRLRDVALDAPLYIAAEKKETEEESGVEGIDNGVSDPRQRNYSASVMVFDWAEGGDAHSYISEKGSLPTAAAMNIFLQMMKGLRALHRRGIAHRDVKPENVILDKTGTTAKLCDLGFAKDVTKASPEDVAGDPTTCYQAPERWVSSPSSCAVAARSAWGCRRANEPVGEALKAGDIFSAGVSLFMLLGYDCLVNRMRHDPACQRDMARANPDPLPVLPVRNVFQGSRGYGVFELLDAGVEQGGPQDPLWEYWESWGLQQSPCVKGLLDGLLHPLPDLRWNIDEAFEYMGMHPELFLDPVQQ
ncbi:unnamed protein product [Discosporangium mesarthrocarpum]